jgi:restriction endonuclease Mrr
MPADRSVTGRRRTSGQRRTRFTTPRLWWLAPQETSARHRPLAGKVASRSALSYIDGAELVNLMIEHDIGVSNEARIEIKRLDNDYFDEE